MVNQKDNHVKFSLIVPLYNEQENITHLHKEIISALHDYEYELIYVNDGSSDKTFSKTIEAINNMPVSWARIINLSKNYGQSFAFKLGLDNARFSVIIFMDGDLQNDPKDIPLLLDKFSEGYDLVQGVRAKRRDPLLQKILPSKLANLFLRILCGSKFSDLGCSLKVFSKKLVNGLYFYQGFHRILPIYLSLKGAKMTEIEINHRKRLCGKSKYGFSRAAEVFFEIIRINFIEKGSNNFIYITIGIGFILGCLGLLIGFNLVKNINLFGFLGLISFVLGLYLFVIATSLHIIRSFYAYHQKFKEIEESHYEIINYEQGKEAQRS